MVGESNESLFETKKAKGRVIYRIFASTVFLGICLLWIYRITHLPAYRDNGRWIWIGVFVSELWFGFYWILTQSVRWNLVFRSTFKDRLSQRFEQELPGVDIFVCTADPKVEPPILVINTVLSVMAYDYPSEKLSVYLSDDGGSDLTFYALLEASFFAKHWIPYCKKFKVEPRSPAAYFSSISDYHPLDADAEDFVLIKKLYEEMESRIENAARLGRIADNIQVTHTGFSQWSSSSSKRDHDTILQILIDGRDEKATDIDGCVLPTLVYLAREKRPQHPHNFKAGAMNALIRVSSKLSNGDIILNVDCDMYSNNSESIRDALCFLMDKEKGHELAFIQFPQNFSNTTKNDVYGNSLLVICEVELHGLDGNGGPLYIGTGCFHRRESLCGKKFFKGHRNEWNKNICTRQIDENVEEIQDALKGLASCTYEKNTQWGKEMGLKYGCPVEDVITGLSIQCNGWKSIYFNPKRKAFLGVAPTSLGDLLVQHKRWSEGLFQIFLSKYNPAWYGFGKISIGLQMSYCICQLWASNCFATLYYSIFPSISLLHGVSLFPQISSPWFLPFAYVIIAKYSYSLAEFLWSGGTVLGWWNEQRIWLYKRSTSYLFGFIDTTLKQFGFSETSFVITSKVSDEEVSTRFEQEMMEFGTSSPMFTILATLALFNMICFVLFLTKKVIAMDSRTDNTFNELGMQIFLCGILVLVNFPLFHAMFVRKDNGKMPMPVVVKSALVALLAWTCFTFM